MSKSDLVCVPLPSNVTNWIATQENNKQYVLNFLQNTLPPADCKSIEEELRKTLIFQKIKSKRSDRIKRKGKSKRKFLSNRKRILIGLNKIGSRHSIKYSDILPLNELWLGYMQQVLGNKSESDLPNDLTDPIWENINQQLLKADLHGARISVVGSKCPSLIGISGIVIQDTKNIFRVCSIDNVTRTLPKDAIVIKIYLNQIAISLFGKQFSVRPTERTVKKFKSARIYEL